MNYSFVNKPAVKLDIIDATNHYKNINTTLAKQFLSRIREAKAFIESNPVGFEVKYKDVRTVLLKQFPYHIHYIIDDSKKQIVILAIIHAYKKPNNYLLRE